jgi:hypothetical protein
MHLLERLQGWLSPESGLDDRGRLFVDQQHDGYINAPHEAIIDAHRKYQVAGTGYVTCDRIIEQPFFMQSDHSPLIQIADVFAYNVYRKVRDYRGTTKMYPFYERILPKCRGYKNWYGGRMEAPYGLKILSSTKDEDRAETIRPARTTTCIGHQTLLSQVLDEPRIVARPVGVASAH